MHMGLRSRKMISEGWISIWALKEQTLMDMEKEGMKTLIW
jgi:hypothetical protein